MSWSQLITLERTGYRNNFFSWASLNSCVLVKPKAHCITSADKSSLQMDVPWVHPQFLPSDPSLFSGHVWRSIGRTGFGVKKLKFKFLICNLLAQWPKTNCLLSLALSLQERKDDCLCHALESDSDSKLPLEEMVGVVFSSSCGFLRRLSKWGWPCECPILRSLWARTRGHCPQISEHL